MISEKAKQYIMDHAEKNGDTCQYYVHEEDAFKAILIAEEEVKLIFQTAFNNVAKGEFQAIIHQCRLVENQPSGELNNELGIIAQKGKL